MSKTGIYRYNPITKEMEKISDEIPKIRPPVFWDHRWDHSGFKSEALGAHFKSKEDKRRVMEEQNVMESG